MVVFDVSKKWVIIVPPGAALAARACADLSRYIGLLAEADRGSLSGKPFHSPEITDAENSSSYESVIVLNSDDEASLKNGFSWRAKPDRIEIFGESGRGLCNGIYCFLSALGISWPVPGQEKLPVRASGDSGVSSKGQSSGFYLEHGSVYEPSKNDGSDSAGISLRRFVPAGRKEIKYILKNCEDFAAWAARRRYDTAVFPLAFFASESKKKKLNSLKKYLAEYGILLEAGGRDLSALVPRKYFFLHRDSFRMEEGRRKRAHHFCPTNPGTTRIIGIEGGKMFRAAEDVSLFHLWPDKGAEAAWCSCPTCRAFTPQEQYRIGVSAAADVLASINPGASITFLEKAGEDIKIPLRKNISSIEKLPEEKEFNTSAR